MQVTSGLGGILFIMFAEADFEAVYNNFERPNVVFVWFHFAEKFAVFFD